MRSVLAAAYVIGWWAFLSRSGCRFGHDWRTIDYPAVMYPGVADWAGTKECRRCDKFSYYTASDYAAFWANR